MITKNTFVSFFLNTYLGFLNIFCFFSCSQLWKKGIKKRDRDDETNLINRLNTYAHAFISYSTFSIYQIPIIFNSNIKTIFKFLLFLNSFLSNIYSKYKEKGILYNICL